MPGEGRPAIKVQHRDTRLAEKLCSGKFFVNADSGPHLPRDVEPPTGTAKCIFIDLHSDFCHQSLKKKDTWAR